MTLHQYHFDTMTSAHRDDLLREAASDRLAAQLRPSHHPFRLALALALRTLADHLDKPVALQPALRRA